MNASSTGHIDALLNDFAVRCFRDVADADYIAARLAYRAGLFAQFHWSALQAVEKYYKAILLFNRIKSNRVGHSLAVAQKLAKKLPFETSLSPVVVKFMQHLDDFGTIRYLEGSYFIHGPALSRLDKAVWELRRYCKVLNYDIQTQKGVVNMLTLELDAIKRADVGPPSGMQLVGGMLETILKKREHPARQALLWKNMFYTLRARPGVRMPTPFHATNSPLFLHPELLDHVTKLVYIPADLQNAYRQSYARRKKEEQAQVSAAKKKAARSKS